MARLRRNSPLYPNEAAALRALLTRHGYSTNPSARPGENEIPTVRIKRGRNPRNEQVELRLFIDNDGALYRQMTAPIQKNLTKKFVKGTYNHALALKLWKRLADEGAKKYAKDFDLGSGGWNRIFSVADRAAVAQELADHWHEEMKLGNRHNPPRRRRGKTKMFGPGKRWKTKKAMLRFMSKIRRKAMRVRRRSRR